MPTQAPNQPGSRPTPDTLVDIPRLVTAYYSLHPDPSVPAQRVAFGTSGHRGSAFGEVGLVQHISQKRFDTLLWDAFRKAPCDRPIILEGESQRIGKISLPGTVYETMAVACKVWCSASLETRVRRLAGEYACLEYREAMAMALERIKKKLGGVRYAEIKTLLDNWDVEGIARGLVEHYYDRLYYKNRPWTPDVEIDLEDFGRAGQRLAEFWSERQRR